MVDIGYGLALYRSTHSGRVNWWPASLQQVGSIPLAFWCWVWIGVGLFLLTGVFAKRDQFHFASTMILKGAWTVGAFDFWWNSTGITGGGWGLVCLYAGITGTILLTASWPEVPSVVDR